MIKKILYFAFFISVFASCKKEDTAYTTTNPNYSGNVSVNFDNYFYADANKQSVFGLYSVSFPLKDTFTEIGIKLKISNSVGVLDHDVKVYLSYKDEIVYDHNDLTGDGFMVVDSAHSSSFLNFDFSKPVIIPKGQRDVTIPMKINVTKMGIGANSFGLSIDSVLGADLTVGTQSRLVANILALNPYDGMYLMKGYIYRLLATGVDTKLTGNFKPYLMPLSTNTNTQVQFGLSQHWADGSGVAIGYPILDIDPVTNAVKVTSTLTTLAVPVGNDPAYNTCHYDPATKTFFISYVWNSGRLCTDTLVYQGPR